MPQPLPPSFQPEPENKCLGFLFMKLEGIPIPPEKPESSKLKPRSSAIERINLYLTLQFNEQRELLLGGYLKFGLKGGVLKLKLKNGEVPLTSRKLAGSFQLVPQNQRQQQQESKTQKNIEGSRTESESKIKATSGTSKTGERTEFSSCQITAKGSEKNPVWVFEVKMGDSILKGSLKKTLLATLNVTAKPCYVEATFEVLPGDVCAIEAQGLWSPDITKKRSAAIERGIVRRFQEQKLKPYLSRQELRL